MGNQFIAGMSKRKIANPLTIERLWLSYKLDYGFDLRDGRIKPFCTGYIVSPFPSTFERCMNSGFHRSDTFNLPLA